ncbi:RNA polymerase [Leptospira wolffii]|uniref:RNA polymerase n=1 Tax=Leptospira wolffii TaxID=409998 RepID=A0A2M9ZB11_9LEPT|nr:RNA polymerase [Leptospira wolffii]PJZ65600.1 RNA polymerase [Leptospira wolffii]TGK56189.1 RNA polymerase [Leptospira wolffii]TGK72235.1 RNA polymerase [Leptospira wolffii]TGK72858.1 RNA polymerase [Leptospira wolffii]TGL27812.1 RNA polymerase [Leptospira wolffii]
MEPTEFPKGIPAPALRGLASIGIRRLDQLIGKKEEELLELHGVGPKAIRLIREALRKEGKDLS